MDAQQARNFLYGVTDLECLEAMPELIEGIKEAADLLVKSPKASFMNTLSTYHEKMQQAAIQEVKDSLLCQLVLTLFPYVPNQEARDKIGEILQEYNSEDRIPEQQLSPIAQSILTIITESTKPPKSSYIVGWHICDQLGIARIELDCSYTKYDFALKELVDAGLVEELPDLGYRYRLKRQEREG